MGQGRGSSGLIGSSQATELTGGEAQEVRRLSHRTPTLLKGVEDEQTILFSWCQGDRSHEDPDFALRRERTFSLNA